MSSKSDETPRATGGCLCGAVQYEVRGPLRDVIKCHCSKCRRTHGHIAAYASTRREDLVLKKDRGLKWFRSVTDETPNVHRGFCQERGVSLFGIRAVAIAFTFPPAPWMPPPALKPWAMSGPHRAAIITKSQTISRLLKNHPKASWLESINLEKPA